MDAVDPPAFNTDVIKLKRELLANVAALLPEKVSKVHPSQNGTFRVSEEQRSRKMKEKTEEEKKI